MEHVKVYRGRLPDQIYIHLITTPVFTTPKKGIYPRLEIRKDGVMGWSGPDYDSRYVNGKYEWIPFGKVVECYYDAKQRILL